jgi:hypothetical protein
VRLDHVGHNPFDHSVSVLSEGHGVGSIPPDRWSGVVVIDPPAQHAEDVVEAARSACTPGGWVCVLSDESGRRTLRKYIVS